MDRTLPTLPALVISLPMLLAGCGAKADTLAFANTTQGESVPLASFDDCPLLAANVTQTDQNGNIVIARACFKDDTGKYYDALYSDGPEPPGPGLAVLPAGRKYAFVVQFTDAWIPPASAATSPEAARAYASVDNIFSEEACMQLPEDNEANRVATTTTLAGNTLTVSLNDGVPAGEQVVPIIDFSKIYPALPACSFESFSMGCINFNGRFYVGHAPSVEGPCPAMPDASADGSADGG
jgi:hypothetical protein